MCSLFQELTLVQSFYGEKKIGQADQVATKKVVFYYP